MPRAFEEISDEEWSNHNFAPSRVLKRPKQRPSQPPPPIDSFAYNPKAGSGAGTSTATVVLSDDDSDFDLGADGGSRRAAKSQRVPKRPHNGPPSRPSPPVQSFRRNPQPSNAAAASGVSDSDDDFVLPDDYFDRPTSSSKTSSIRRKGKSQRPLKGPQLKPHLRAPPAAYSFSRNPKRSKFASDVGLSSSEDDEFDLTKTSSLHRSAKRPHVQKRPQHKPHLQDPQSFGSSRRNPKPSKAAATTGLSDSDEDEFDITDSDSDLPEDSDLPASLSRTARPRHTSRRSRRLTSFAIDISEEDEEDLADDDFDYQDPRPNQQRPGRRFVIGDDDDSDVAVAVEEDDEVNWSELEKEDEDEGYNGERSVHGERSVNMEEPEGDVVGTALRKCSRISSNLRKELFGSSARDCESYAEIDASTCRIVTQVNCMILWYMLFKFSFSPFEMKI